ncbi:glycosyltransferase family 2 protein [Pedobacter agri]|uniref:glycosyltransferase family 2 protein n=1 Tax=Pedobacter agri TaxID=454586 RepID=UPI00292D72E5|nr:glycosyltransferase family 2 protein [Pedobacter agri]
MPKPVAIIILNWNTPAHTISCVLSITQYCDAKEYDIIIADNGSTDDSLSILKEKFPNHILIDNKSNLGFAEGNNVAFKYSIAEGYTFSLLLNNDTEVDENFLSPLINHLRQNPETVAVQPSIYYLHKKDTLWNGGSYYNKWWGITYSNNKKPRQSLRSPEQVEWLTGCCFLVRNDALKKVGLFTGKFFLYYEDVDLSFRLRKFAGRLDYLPTSKVYHEAGVSGKQKVKNSEGELSPIIHYYVNRNKLWFLRRYANPAFLIFIFGYNAMYYSILLCYFLIRNRKQKAKFLLKGIKEGLFTPQTTIWS